MSTLVQGFDVSAQRMAALKLANRTRIARKEVERRAREEGALAALARFPQEAGKLQLGRVVARQRGWGPKKVSEFFSRVASENIRPEDLLGNLSAQQLGYLRFALGEGS